MADRTLDITIGEATALRDKTNNGSNINFRLSLYETQKVFEYHTPVA